MAATLLSPDSTSSSGGVRTNVRWRSHGRGSLRHEVVLPLAALGTKRHAGRMERSAPAQSPVVVADALDTFTDLWSPRIATRVNDHEVRLTKIEGEYVWHHHDSTDEMFMVIDGELTIELRDQDGTERAVVLGPGSLYTVPLGIEHRPVAAPGTSILLVERSGTLTTGSYDGAVPDHIDSTAGRELV
jgi:mannose-6-phosphate isomerase-like protein (cupin superfamily)